MATVSYSSREIDCKLVYAGPGLSGKTTNVKFIHSQIPSSDRGKLISLATGNERTLFFDFLPINTGSIYGFKVRLHLYSVPGQAMYTDSRQLILQGVDGIIFVADSQRARMDANIASLRDLKDNLKNTKRKGLSLVLQTNKRDLPDILPTDVIRKRLGLERVPCIESIATDGTGVFETLRKASRIVMRRLHRQFSLALDQNGQPHVAHYARLRDGSDWYTLLRYARYDGYGWNLSTIEVDNQSVIDSAGTSLAIDSQGRRHLGYYHNSSGDLRGTSSPGTCQSTLSATNAP